MHTKHLSASCLSATQHSRDIHCSTVSTGTTNLLVLNVDVSLVKGPWSGATRQKTLCLRDLPLKRQWQANDTAQWLKALVTNQPKDLSVVPGNHVVERTDSHKLSSSLSMHTTANGHFYQIESKQEKAKWPPDMTKRDFIPRPSGSRLWGWGVRVC